MAFDGIVTFAMVKELQSQLLLGKIDKVYQPQLEELVFVVHTKEGNKKLLVSAQSNSSRVHLIEEMPQNPPQPYAFCMLLRKHLQGGRIVDIAQKDSERIIEISLETLNELGFTVSKKLIMEVMGRHSNVTLVDMTTGKIIDSIKRISIDVNRVRQVLPGKVYEYPPVQEKKPFKDVTREDMEHIRDSGMAYLKAIGGISPAFASNLEDYPNPYENLRHTVEKIEGCDFTSKVYLDQNKNPKDFYVDSINNFEEAYEALEFGSLSQAIDYYFEHKEATNRINQKSSDLIKSIKTSLDKALLKKQRLLEDIEKANNSEDLRLYAELLTANLHLVKAGSPSVDVLNYYDGSTVTIPLDVRYSPSKNAQQYFKKYGKAKTSIKEKEAQLKTTQSDIDYLESVLEFLDHAATPEDVDAIRVELIETGYIKRRKTGFKEKKYKSNPIRIKLSNGMEVLIGRNNKENDYITTKLADKQDLWLHTKDIPGSHVLLRTGGTPVDKLDADLIYSMASLAAFHSKAKDSSKVPVDYVTARYVKKPAGAKPGMVIFTNNRTVYVDPKDKTQYEES